MAGEPEQKADAVASSSPAVPLNDLKRGYEALAEELEAAATRVLRNGWYVHGPEHQAFEREFGEYLGGVECIGVGNGTDALEISLKSLLPSPGSVVVTAANAGMYSSTAIRRAGLIPRYADVDPETLLLTPESVEAVLGDDVSVVVVTHLYGRLADVAGIRAVARARGVAVLEDCAQAAGAGEPGRRAGGLGDVAAFSFYPTKNLGALGDGGAITTRRPDVAEQARRLRQYGWEAKYRVGQDGGRNSRLDELQAAFLRVRLPHLDDWNQRRREVIARYVEAADGVRVRVLPASGADHVGHLAVLVAQDRAAVRAALDAAGIQSDVHYPVPDHQQAPFVDHFASVSLPVTEEMAGRILTLPCFPELGKDEVDRVCTVLRDL
ncbi:DegT/DnrJ/EryC1/StrS family aminotransferase [Blastococcus saxobsidens]|uniref:dTDP-4-amino-4,6-dideoxygalactose transaminase n=1 Tax=Blastococcus saxobsidens TaxID=138336 RepID=A0A4Q7YAG3_9ACTN|nr:DegT/DnrJ/EryC1/StrS family aminotransferase [Blastococcus saxobsidens]RZU33075.1 dTDP-4-amino-4,6-dideoxygalactose transaminase [Blastococcus saxobsidens]